VTQPERADWIALRGQAWRVEAGHPALVPTVSKLADVLEVSQANLMAPPLET
jgi:hypothetical protein